jgi:hypothetical protein
MLFKDCMGIGTMAGLFSAARLRIGMLFALCASSTLHAATTVDDFVSAANDGQPIVVFPLDNDDISAQGGLSGAVLTQGQGMVSYDPSSFTVSFTPAPGFTGVALVEYTAFDEVSPTTAIGQITFSISPPSPALQAMPDSVSVPHNDGSMTAPIAIAVLDNDTLESDMTPSVGLEQSLTPSGAGTLTPTGSGFELVPAENFSGTETMF